MITFFVLAVAILSIIAAIALVILAGGAGVILAFSDIIVCGIIIGLLVRLFMRRK